MVVCKFFVGLLVTLAVGQLVVWPFLWGVRRLSKVPQRTGEGVPPWIVGAFERTLAFIVGIAAHPNAAWILAGWLGAKLALNWQRPILARATKKQRLEFRVYGISALMAGVLSVGIGYYGGHTTKGGGWSGDVVAPLFACVCERGQEAASTSRQ